MTAPSAEAPSLETIARIRAEARARMALDDVARAKDELYAALFAAPRHGRAALESLEVDDDAGLEHHLDHFFRAARAAHVALKAVKRLQGRIT